MPVPLDEDHISISKIKSKESMVYKRVTRFSRDCLAEYVCITPDERDSSIGGHDIRPWAVAPIVD